MSDLGLIGLRQFREKLESIEEPVQVIKSRGSVKVLGVWLPQGGGFERIEHEDGVTFVFRRKVSSKR